MWPLISGTLWAFSQATIVFCVQDTYILARGPRIMKPELEEGLLWGAKQVLRAAGPE